LGEERKVRSRESGVRRGGKEKSCVPKDARSLAIGEFARTRDEEKKFLLDEIKNLSDNLLQLMYYSCLNHQSVFPE